MPGGKGLGLGGAKLHRKVLRDNIQGLTKDAIHRLAFSAGVMNVQGMIYEESRSIIRNVLEQILQGAVNISNHERHKRISAENVEEAIRLAHQKVPYLARVLRSGDEGDVKRCQVGDSNTLERKIKYYQKQSGCVHFSRTAFERLVREIVQDYTTEKQFTKDAMGVLQLTIEAYLVRLMSAANQLVVHADRKTLTPKDLRLANTIGNDA